jgi:DDE domain
VAVRLRAVDQQGQVIDILVSKRRNVDAARRFFRRALATLKVTPAEVVTDKAPVYPRVLDEALLRCLIGGQADAVHVPVSDRLGELGERGGDPQRPSRFGSEFVVAAAQILHEPESGDDDSSGAVGA